MSTHIQKFTCQQNQSKQSSPIDLVPSTCKRMNEYATKLDSSTRTQVFNRSFLIPLIKSKPGQFCQETFDISSYNLQRRMKRRTFTLGTDISLQAKEEKQGKKRLNRESIFSLISVKTRNNDARITEGSDEKKGKTYTLYSSNSKIRSTSTLDFSIQSTCHDSLHSSNDESSSIPVTTSLASSPVISPSITTVSSSSSTLQEEMQNKANSLLRNNQSEICNKEDIIVTSEPTPGSNNRNLNFFQEQQDQEYRIAKAWLEAEEIREASPTATGLDVISVGSPEFPIYDIWIAHPRLSYDNRFVTDFNGRNSEEYADIGKNPFRSITSNPKSFDDENVQYDGISTIHHLPKITSMSEEKDLNSIRQKHNSSISDLAQGVRKLLSRRTGSS